MYMYTVFFIVLVLSRLSNFKLQLSMEKKICQVQR